MKNLFNLTIPILIILILLFVFYSTSSVTQFKKISSIHREELKKRINSEYNKMLPIEDFNLSKIRFCSPKSKVHNKNMHYVNGWTENCNVFLVTTLFFKSFNCLKLEIRTQNKDLTKMFFENKYPKVKSGINYLEFKDLNYINNDKIEINFCKNFEDNNSYNMVTINWLPFKDFKSYKHEFKVLRMSVS